MSDSTAPFRGRPTRTRQGTCRLHLRPIPQCREKAPIARAAPQWRFEGLQRSTPAGKTPTRRTGQPGQSLAPTPLSDSDSPAPHHHPGRPLDETRPAPAPPPVGQHRPGIETRAGGQPAAGRAPTRRGALAEEFGVSRSSVREAIQKLVARGLLVSRHGGGTFVKHARGLLPRPDGRSARGATPEAQRDLIEFRHPGGACAYYAAQRANRPDRERLKAAFERACRTATCSRVASAAPRKAASTPSSTSRSPRPATTRCCCTPSAACSSSSNTTS